MTCLVSFHVCTYYTIFHHVLSLNHVAFNLVVRAYLITLIVDPFLAISRPFPILSPSSFARSGLVIIRNAYTALNLVHTFIRVTLRLFGEFILRRFLKYLHA